MIPHQTPLRLSLALLILVNVIPLIGVVLWDWSVFELMVLFWAENVVIGLMYVLRMGTLLVLRRALKALFLIPFFTFHYGAFCAGHGIAVMMIFGPAELQNAPFLEMVAVAMAVLIALKLPLAAIGSSHFVSYIVNFLINREYEVASIDTLAGSPYNRIIMLHLTILFGGIVVEALGAPFLGLVMLVVIKTYIDGWAHVSEHTALQAAQSRG